MQVLLCAQECLQEQPAEVVPPEESLALRRSSPKDLESVNVVEHRIAGASERFQCKAFVNSP